MSDEEVASYFGNNEAPVVDYIDVGEKRVRYLWQDNRHATTAIFVHGAPGSSSAFIDYFYDQELKSKVNLVSIDRPGYGYSGFGNAEPSLLEQAKVVNALVAHLKLNQVILVGHSLGAPIIVKAFFEQPERYAGLVLVAGSVDPEQEAQEWYRPWLRNRLAKLLLPASLFVTNEEIFFLKDQLIEMESSWGKITVPIIMIQGDSDRLVPKENVVFVKEKVNDTFLEVWLESEVNHFIPWNRPDLIVNAILKLEGKL
ncbi:MAG: alpha/beta hydrolase [Reichenbachiella sp.]|uniref:alpha/beta fold hydrolase n=1 Tax=Reichenbachiella sp. TaxID=2184521 RepID=UPI003265E286